MSNDSIGIGIDISKDHLDAHRLSDGAARQVKNTPSGFRALQCWIGADLPARVIYEPTGAYHGAFEQTCADHMPLVKVNPLQARRFAQSRGCVRQDRCSALSAMTRQSGRWRGRAFIQAGRKPLCDAFYMSALVTIRFPPDMATKYCQMKAAGKPTKTTLVAVMRKRLILANTLVKDDRV